jgi:hypothetical protein
VPDVQVLFKQDALLTGERFPQMAEAFREILHGKFLMVGHG